MKKIDVKCPGCNKPVEMVVGITKDSPDTKVINHRCGSCGFKFDTFLGEVRHLICKP